MYFQQIAEFWVEALLMALTQKVGAKNHFNGALMVDLDWTVILLVIVAIQLFCIARTLAAIFAVIRLYKY